MDTKQLWQSVLGELELSLSKATFVTWLQNTFISDFSENHITVGVPSVFAKSWVEKKYNVKIVELLRKLTQNFKLQVFYAVENPKNFLKKELFEIITRQEIDQDLAPFLGGQAQKNQSRLNSRYRFENFIVGKGNELAHAASLAVAANPGKTYNPLFLYGGVGLGKTHLMQAIGNDAITTHQNIKVLYITSETFTNEYIQSVRDGKMTDFKDKYRTVDILLIDDIQFISGKEGTQEAFFHTFNELHQQNKQIVISSDRPPKALNTLEARLQSRFESGMIADVIQPDFETRVAILESKCKEKNFIFEPEIIAYISNTIHSNIRELEGALIKIIAYHQLNNTQPTIENVKNILSTITLHMQKQSITVKTIMETISRFFDITSDNLIGTSREKRFVVPRQIMMFLMREELKSSFPTIGQELGGRDHTTAMHACDKIKREMKKDDKTRQTIEVLRQKLYSSCS